MSEQADLESEAGIKKFHQRFWDCAARGDLDELKTLLGESNSFSLHLHDILLGESN